MLLLYIEYSWNISGQKNKFKFQIKDVPKIVSSYIVILQKMFKQSSINQAFQ